MEIVWHGHSCFRLKTRDVTVITDPYAKETGYNLGRPTADIVSVSHDHAGHNNVAAVGGEPRVLRGPGEYEIRGVPIVGIQTNHDPEKGRLRGRNTAFVFVMDDVTICHLGDLGEILTTAQIESLPSSIDVLLVPVGGATTLNAAEAAEVISLLEPKLVIPMHYRTDQYHGERELDPVDVFGREMGAHDLTPQSRLAVTRTSLPDDTQVVVLEPRRG